MNTNAQKIDKFLLPVCGAVALISTVLPFAETGADSEYYSDSMSLSLISGISEGMWMGTLLILVPIIMIALNFIAKLQPYKKIIAPVAPAAGLLVTIANCIAFKNVFKQAGDSVGDIIDMDFYVKPQIGFFLLIGAYLVAIVYGIFYLKGLSFDKQGFETLKETGLGIDAQNLAQIKDKAVSKVNAAIDTVSNTVGNVSASVQEKAQQSGAENSSPAEHTAAPVRTGGRNRQLGYNDTLELIEKLSDMKERGVLTAEEFQAKKAQLLENIQL